MIKITNGSNSYNVYPDQAKSGNLILVCTEGTDLGTAYVSTPETYEGFIKNGGYHQLKDNKKIPMFI